MMGSLYQFIKNNLNQMVKKALKTNRSAVQAEYIRQIHQTLDILMEELNKLEAPRWTENTDLGRELENLKRQLEIVGEIPEQVEHLRRLNQSFDRLMKDLEALEELGLIDYSAVVREIESMRSKVGMLEAKLEQLLTRRKE